MKTSLRFGIPSLVILSLLMGTMGAPGLARAHAGHDGHMQTAANIGGTNMPYPTDNQSGGAFDASSRTNINIGSIKIDANADAKVNAQAQTSTDQATGTANENSRTYFDNYSDRFENVIEKLNAVYERLVQIANRVDARMRKASAEGVNITASSKFVSSARAELAKAKTAIAAASATFKIEMNATATDNLTKETIPSAFPKTISQLRAAKDSLKKAHRDLMKAIGSLMPEVNPGARATTSTTANVNITN